MQPSPLKPGEGRARSLASLAATVATVPPLTVLLARTAGDRLIVGANLLVSGASVLVRAELKDLGGFPELAGRKVGVLVGTTTAQALRGALTALNVKAEVQIFTSHDLGLAALEGGAIDAYFADRELLVGLLKKSAAPDKLAISQGQFTYEPYGLAMRKGEDRLRLAIDRALAQLFASGAAAELVQRNFGRPASQDLQMIYTIQSFPD